MRFIGTLLILMFWVPPVCAFELCFFTDLECIAPLLLPNYDSIKDSVKEWSSSKGMMVARNNHILAKLRFDEQSLSVLRNGKPYGIEIEAVVKGANASSVTLNHIYHTFPSSTSYGQTKIFMI